MLSILIPTYNYDCQLLVNSLNHQARKAGTEYEIIVLNDGSTRPLNLTNCQLIVSPRNLGRAAGRNLLADKAQYPYLLFVDSDSMPADDQYIARWLKHIPTRGSIVLLGGRVYNPPTDRDHALLPLYGQRERNRDNRAKTFTSPNFLIDRSTFRAVRFNQSFTRYGHEDTVFGIELRRRGYDYQTIDNPVTHCHIESNADFLEKTRQALQSLHSMVDEYPELGQASRLIRWADITNLICPGRFAQAVERRLIRHPNVTMLQIYKLAYYKSL